MDWLCYSSVILISLVAMPIPGEPKKTTREKGDLNTIVKNYLSFYNKGKKTRDGDDLKTMDIVEKMIIHCWIITLLPDLGNLKEFVPVDPAVTVDTVKDNIIKELKNTGKEGVENALFRFRKNLNMVADNEITKETIAALSHGRRTKRLDEAHEFHKFSEKMYLQSYVMVFVPASSENTVPLNFLNDDRAEEQTNISKYRVTDWEQFYASLDDDSSEEVDDLDLSD